MQVHIANPEGFARKIEALKAGGAQQLHIVADFDYTLTKANHQGAPVSSTFGLMRANGYLSPEYVKASYALHDTYMPFELDLTLEPAFRMEKMREWWSEHMELLKRSGMNSAVIQELIERHLLVPREGCGEFIALTVRHNIPLLVFSGGIGEIIEGFIAKEGGLHPNVHVIANFFNYDASGALTGYKSEIIHVLNKGEVAIRGTPYAKEVECRRNVVLLGDSLGDAHMAAGMPHDTVLRVGFLNGRTDRIEAYAQAFDVVLLDDCSFDYVTELLKEITE